MISDVQPQIVDLLRAEAQIRRVRVMVALGVLALLVVAFPGLTGVRPVSPRIGGLALVSGAILVMLVLFSSGAQRLRPAQVALVSSAIVLSPLLFAETLRSGGDGFWARAMGCLVAISILGVLSLLIVRVILGRFRRRFGGARALQASAAALAASLAIGLHCAENDAAHLMSHVLAAAFVTLLCSRVILRE